jgi:hypothetical protein
MADIMRTANPALPDGQRPGGGKAKDFPQHRAEEDLAGGGKDKRHGVHRFPGTGRQKKKRRERHHPGKKEDPPHGSKDRGITLLEVFRFAQGPSPHPANKKGVDPDLIPAPL